MPIANGRLQFNESSTALTRQNNESRQRKYNRIIFYKYTGVKNIASISLTFRSVIMC